MNLPCEANQSSLADVFRCRRSVVLLFSVTVGVGSTAGLLLGDTDEAATDSLLEGCSKLASIGSSRVSAATVSMGVNSTLTGGSTGAGAGLYSKGGDSDGVAAKGCV